MNGSAAVATSTSPMASASLEGSPTPEEPSFSKAFIMPVTVPVTLNVPPPWLLTSVLIAPPDALTVSRAKQLSLPGWQRPVKQKNN